VDNSWISEEAALHHSAISILLSVGSISRTGTERHDAISSQRVDMKYLHGLGLRRRRGNRCNGYAPAMICSRPSAGRNGPAEGPNLEIKVACDPRLPPNVSPICAMSRLSLSNYAMRPVVLFTSTHGKSEPGGKRHLEYTGEENRVAAVVCVAARFTLVQRGSVQCRSVCPQW